MLSLDRNVPPQLISDLRARAQKDGRVAWPPVVREYVEALSLAQGDIRIVLQASENSAVELLDGLAAAYRLEYGGDDKPLSVSAVERAEDGRWVEEVALDFDYSERVQWLRQKNGPMVNLHKVEIKG